jgi:hypothetical protein
MLSNNKKNRFLNIGECLKRSDKYATKDRLFAQNKYSDSFGSEA